MAVSKKRAALLRELESIVGTQCFNAKTQNRGRGGVLQSEGRSFRYPITFSDEVGNVIKRRNGYDDLSIDQQMTGHYAFGTMNSPS